MPHSRVARGERDIAAAWFAGATDRYAHGVLGDAIEAARLMVETRAGRRLQFELPAHRVFEDLEPRLADLDGDGRDEIIVVESDINLGASLAVYALAGDRLVKRAATVPKMPNVEPSGAAREGTTERYASRRPPGAQG